MLFDVPILGAGTSIEELFALGRAGGGSGSVGLESYDWEYLQPLRENVDYRVDGGIVGAERVVTGAGAVVDRVGFCIELFDGERLVAVGDQPLAVPAMIVVGDVIPPWVMPSVDPARMKTMAAILRDPYPVHWDRVANEALGLGGRVINQGPLKSGVHRAHADDLDRPGQHPPTHRRFRSTGARWRPRGSRGDG